jgi:hypothetical protein
MRLQVRESPRTHIQLPPILSPTDFGETHMVPGLARIAMTGLGHWAQPVTLVA